MGAIRAYSVDYSIYFINVYLRSIQGILDGILGLFIFFMMSSLAIGKLTVRYKNDTREKQEKITDLIWASIFYLILFRDYLWFFITGK